MTTPEASARASGRADSRRQWWRGGSQHGRADAQEAAVSPGAGPTRGGGGDRAGRSRRPRRRGGSQCGDERVAGGGGGGGVGWQRGEQVARRAGGAGGRRGEERRRRRRRGLAARRAGLAARRADGSGGRRSKREALAGGAARSFSTGPRSPSPAATGTDSTAFSPTAASLPSSSHRHSAAPYIFCKEAGKEADEDVAAAATNDNNGEGSGYRGPIVFRVMPLLVKVVMPLLVKDGDDPRFT